MDTEIIVEYFLSNFMSSRPPGYFSTSFSSLQLQLRMLLEGSGGERTINFLDTLAQLGRDEQEFVLRAFSGVIDKIVSGEKRFFTSDDIAQKEMEDELYKEIIAAMGDAAESKDLVGKRLEVLRGGKRELNGGKSKKRLIDFQEAKRSRKGSSKPILQ